MPSIALSKEQKLNKQRIKLDQEIEGIAEELDLQLYKAGIKKAEIAEIVGIDRSNVSRQFKNRKLTMPVYLAAKLLLDNKSGGIEL